MYIDSVAKSVSELYDLFKFARKGPLFVGLFREHGKLVDNFRPESDVTSLQDPVLTCP